MSSGACPLVAGGHGERLQYNGGPVQHEPQLYLLFWGSAWEAHKNLGSELAGLFYGNLKAENDVPGGTAAWQGILSQYYSNTAGPYKSARIVAESHVNNISAPQNITDAAVQQEASEWIRELYAKGTPPNANAQFIVLPTPGSTYADEDLVRGHEIFACGYHFVTSEAFGSSEEKYSYTLIPYGGDVVGENSKHEKENCNYAGSYGGSEQEQLEHSTSFVASHEFSESVTDPLTTRKYLSQGEDPYPKPGNPAEQELFGWTGERENDNTEVADECVNDGPFQLPKRAWVTKLYDDEGGNKCNLEDPPYPLPPAPTSTTGLATGVEEHSASLEGSVDPNGPDAHYYFQYGPTEAYGSDAPTPPGTDAGFGTVPVGAKATIAGLAPNTKYYYRLVASNWVGTSYGAAATFKTPAWAVEAVASPPTSGEGKLAAISCLSESQCTAVGRYYKYTGKKNTFPPLAETFANHAWNATAMQSSLPYAEILDGSCSASTACTAVGKQQTEGPQKALIERWNGSEWKEEASALYEPNSQAEIVGVACPSASFCVAVGNDSTREADLALVEQWEGGKWKLASAPSVEGELSGVSCPSTSVCTAVGNNRFGEKPVLIEHLASGKWRVESAPTPSAFTDDTAESGLGGVSCATISVCTAVGGYIDSETKSSVTFAEHWNGTAWSIESTSNEIAGGTLRRVSCATSTACTAVGHAGSTGFAERLISGAWETETISAPAGSVATSLSGVSCWTALDCRAAGSYKQTNGAEVPFVEEQELTK